MTALRVLRNDDHRNTRSIAEEVERLNVTGVIVATTLIEGDEDGSVLPKVRILFDRVHNLFSKAFKEIQFGRGRVSIHKTARLHERNCGKRSVFDVVVEI